MEAPLVTVCCITYNQKPYVKETIESFLKQRTDFPFDIFIHDDASTDGTQEILLDYQKRYPDRIRLKLQKENQYSKNPRIFAKFMWPEVTAKYTALCEGDDYWTDENKLQIQIDWLEEHPAYSLSVTDADMVKASGEKTGSVAPYPEDTDMPMEDLICGGGGFIASASVVTRTELLRSLPEFYYESTVGDAPLQLYLAASGKTRWHAKSMCAYRVFSAGSWSVEQLMEDTSRPIAMHESMLRMLNGFSAWSGGKWPDALSEAETYHRFQIARLKNDLKALKKPEFRKLYDTLTPRVKLRMYCAKYCPAVIRLYRKIKMKKGF